jgi:superfamily II DNA helicase RecQ
VIQAKNPEEGTEELNRFLRGHRVVTIEKKLLNDDGMAFWTACVEYLDGPARTAPGRHEPKIDYKDILDDIEFPVFARLRVLRKQIATREAIPAYAVFTNEQLAQIVKSKACSRADFARIEGIGDSKIEKYAEEFIGIMKEVFSV